MAMRSVLSRISPTPLTMRASGPGGFRYFSDGKGRVLSEEERAAENVYIQVYLVVTNVREKCVETNNTPIIDLLSWKYTC